MGAITKRVRAVSCAALGCAAVSAAAALAAAPAPKPATAYDTVFKAGRKGVNLSLVTSASSGNVLIAGMPALGSNYAISQLFLDCPKAPKNKGLVGLPFLDFGFPGATFKLKHGKYSFSVTSTQKAFVIGSPNGLHKFKVTFTGTAVSTTEIKGTVKVAGKPCTTKRALPYVAKLNRKDKVAPGS